MDLPLKRLIAAASGAGFVILCESEYACCNLFKDKTSLFFFICQLAILSSALQTALTSLVYFKPVLQTLSMLIVILLIRLVMDISYPMMTLLRLKIICKLHPVLMYIPIFQAVVWIALKYFWVIWILTGKYYSEASIILRATIGLTIIQNIIINILFIVVAKRKFENTIHLKYVVIVNVILIMIECIILASSFLLFSSWDLGSIMFQISIRLEITVLVYIVKPHVQIPEEQLSIINIIA